MAGAAVFGVLTGLSLLCGTALGITYTGDQELIELTIALGMVTGMYAVLAFELWRHRGSLPLVEAGDVWFMGIIIGLSGPFLAFVFYAVFVFLAVRG